MKRIYARKYIFKMKTAIRTLLTIILILLGIGFYLMSSNNQQGNFLVGIAVLLFALVLMPLFLFHRYRGKKMTDYMLTKEKIDKIIENLKL